MLKEIRIRDLGVIDDATLRFAPGLNVLTGETGAGKTMVVQGLGLLLGGRATAALVREGASSAVVEGVLELPAEHAAVERALEAGGEVDQENYCLLDRWPTVAAREHGWAAATHPWECSVRSANSSSPCTDNPINGACSAPTSTAQCWTTSVARRCVRLAIGTRPCTSDVNRYVAN